MEVGAAIQLAECERGKLGLAVQQKAESDALRPLLGPVPKQFHKRGRVRPQFRQPSTSDK